MRVLAVRGCNLASLDGRFDVPLDRPPLAGAGLFAITGPTGAGKSTLLDALCLALFNRTPRLNHRGGVPVGREDDGPQRISSNDARSVLRRGAAEGWAEVEFVGRTGARHRARWAVRRARGRVDGTLQGESVELFDLDPERPVGGTKTEVLAAIQDRLGLTFDQFRRSVLLAQGDFAAFLRADAGDRADLLEQMTGTEIYGELSAAAFERARRETDALDALRGQLASLPLLPDAAREALLAETGEATRARHAARDAKGRAEAALEWHREKVRRGASLREAEGELERAEEAARHAAPLQAELEEVLGARGLAGAVGASDRAEAGEEAARRELALRTGERSRAEEAMAGAVAGLAAAGDALGRAKALREAQRPEVEEARRLDARVEEAGRRAEEAAREAGEAVARAREARGEADGLAARRKGAEDAARQAREWLLERPQVAPVAASWVLWSAELERYVEAHGAAAGAMEARGAALDRHEAAVAALGRAREGLGAAKAALDAAEGEEARWAGAEPDERSAAARLRGERDALEGFRRRLEALERAAREAREIAGEEEAAVREATGADTAARGAEARAGEAAGALGAVRRDLEEAERLYEQARTALALATERGRLRDGEPCPLCGGSEHPYAHLEIPLAELGAGVRARYEALRREEAERVAGEGRSRAEAAAAKEAAVQAGRRLEAVRRRGAVAADRWLEARAGLEEPGLPVDGGDPGAVGAVAERTREVAARLRELRAAEAEAEARAEAARRAREATAARRREWLAADEGLRRSEAEAREAATGLSEVERRLGEAQLAQGRLERALEPAFGTRPDWLDRLRADPRGYAGACARAVEEWRRKEAARDAAETQAAGLGQEAERAEALAAEREGEAGRREEVRIAAAGERDEWGARRGALLGGRPTARVEAEAEAAVEAAEGKAEEAAGAHAAAAAALEAARAREEAAGRAAEDARTTRDEAARALAAALDERGLDLARLRELLSRDEAWIRDRRAELEAGAHARERARAVRDERRAHLAAHEAAPHPTLAAPEAEEAAAAASVALEAAEAGLAHLAGRVAVDDEARRRAGEVRPRIDAQGRIADVWKALSDLIGSRDGKKFRVFAQSLTLDLLLADANAHLGELARRYRLERVPGHDLDLQVVDGDMADEVRSINSLSGGESFLVSLALALGLSSLSSRAASIESMFIDEGFGTLDPRTLEIALAALDSLQAGGRQIGLISHVAGMAERIGVQVQVVPQGSGRSAVRVVAWA
ncbi:AAA family ATPase [Myxococcota bacterium]|nr:AAA family ATPase [Myxococcota bacterium]